MTAANERTTESRRAPAASSGAPPRVLVVDDEEWMRDACTQILQREGFEVATAADAQAGLRLAGQQPPDIVLIDLRMPGIDGMAYLKAVKALDPDVVGIVITGYATLEAAVEAMKAGAYDFLPKPFKPQELRALVRRGLEHRRAALRVAGLLHGEARTTDLYLAMLAHQFRAPLAALRQCVSVVLQGYTGDINPRARGMIEIAAQRTDQMMRFIDDWLMLSRLEEGEELQKVPGVDLVALVRKAIERVKQCPESEKLCIGCLVVNDPGPVQADASALDELFANLLDNAVRYTQPGGAISVEVGGTEDETWVTVRDTGPGIAPDDVGRIFAPFYRGKAQKGIPGTGLGLPIAKRIAEAHGGRIELQTALGHGAAFRVVLPREGPRTPPGGRAHEKTAV